MSTRTSVWPWPHRRSPHHYRISKLCRVSVTLGKGQVTLGKVFAECNTRQTTLGKESHGNADFAECRITGTRQRICRVPWHSANKPRGATPGPALCRVSNGRHSAKFGVLLSVLVRHSAKSLRRGCRHVAVLPSAGFWHSVKCPRQGAATWLFYRVLALGKLAALLTWAGPFAECFGLNTRQSGEFSFFVSVFFVFPYKYDRNIYECRSLQAVIVHHI